MGNRAGKGNRLRWDAANMLTTLSHSVSRKELVTEFQALPVGEKLDLLIRLSDASGAPPSRPGGEGHE